MNTNKSSKIIVNLALVAAAAVAVIGSGLDRVSATEISNQKIIELTNKERDLRGLEPLRIDSSLCRAANLKSGNMLALNYFDHFAHGLSPWVIIQNSGYDYQYAGENLAMDFVTSEGVVNAWMQSQDHRKNILNPNFEDVCIGVASGKYSDTDGQIRNTTMVTQMLGKKKPVILSIASEILYRVFGITTR